MYDWGAANRTSKISQFNLQFKIVQSKIISTTFNQNISMKQGYFLALLVLCIGFVSFLPSSAQNTITVAGIVLDSATQKGLPFAQVSLKTATIGTVTNEEGRFRMEIPASFAGDTLLVGYMGYVTLQTGPTGKAGEDLRLVMKQAAMQLAEVEIVALSPEEVLRRVVENIPKNYGQEPLILTAFVRSRKAVGGKLAEYTEAIIEDLKTGYSLYREKDEKERKRMSNVPLLLKGRVISDTSLVNSIGDLGRSAGCLGCNFVHDFAEFYHNTVLDDALFRSYSFRMEELITPANGKVFHIWFDQKKGVKKRLWKGELFVESATFALLKITQRPSYEAFDQYEKEKYKRSFFIGTTGGWFEEMPLMEWTTTYARRNGSYYLNTIRIENWLTFKQPATGKTVKFSHKNEVVVTDATRDPERIKNFKGDKSIGVNQRWDQLVGQGDDQFWAGYNYLPIEEQLLESLGKLGGVTR
jgi:hypothetical protein